MQIPCKTIWPTVTTENLREITDYAGYKHEFLQLFGFDRGTSGVQRLDGRRRSHADVKEEAAVYLAAPACQTLHDVPHPWAPVTRAGRLGGGGRAPSRCSFKHVVNRVADGTMATSSRQAAE